MQRLNRRPKTGLPAPPTATEPNPDEIDIALSDEEDAQIPGANTLSDTTVDAALQPDAQVDESADLAAVKKAALAQMLGSEGSGENNPDEIALDIDGAETSAPPAKAGSHFEPSSQQEPYGQNEEYLNQEADHDQLPKISRNDGATKFLALSKCLHQGQFLQLLEVESPSESCPPVMTFDPLWLAITKAFHPYMSLRYKANPLPQNFEDLRQAVAHQLHWLQQNLPEGGRVPISEIQQFCQTAPISSADVAKSQRESPDPLFFCTILLHYCSILTRRD